jgi:WD40 repeat protein
MAVGTTDSKIHIYTEDPRVVASHAQSSSPEKARPKLTYIPREVLVGHTDWVRCLAFTQPLKLSKLEEDSYGYGSGDILLASGSQDTYTRLWRFASSPASSVDIDQRPAIDELDRLMEDEIDAKQYAISLGYACFNLD